MANHKNCAAFTINHLGANRKYNLFIVNSKYGNFNQSGTLTLVLIKAFKPYIEEAKAECELWKKAFDDIQNMVNGS